MTKAMARCTSEGCEGMYRPDPRRKTTLCKGCSDRRNAQNPDRRAKLSASMRTLHQDPAYKAKRAPLMKALGRRNAQDPVWRAKASAFARELGLKNGGTVAGAPDRIKAGRSLTEHYLGHIPVEYRDEYRLLQRKTHMTADEITAAILEMVEADQRRYRATGRLPQTERANAG